MDYLNTHQSESLVCFVAEGIKTDLGVKGKSGILKFIETRSAFLSNPSDPIVFHFMPKHCPWLNQLEDYYDYYLLEATYS